MIWKNKSVTFHLNHAVSYHHILALIKKSQLNEENGYQKRNPNKRNQRIVIKKCKLQIYIPQQSCEDPRTTARALLPHKVHLVLMPVVDLQLRQRAGILRDQSTVAQTSGVRKKLILEVLGDPLLDDDVVGVDLRLLV